MKAVLAAVLFFSSAGVCAQEDVKTMLIERALRDMPKAQGEALRPLVIVVHGIGGGERAEGWSKEDTEKWGIDREDIREVSFSEEGRGKDYVSYTDFANRAGDWGQRVQDGLLDIMADPANAGRPVIIVSHSWGTAMTKLALNGGTTNRGTVDPIAEKARGRKAPEPRVAHWFTLGSPIGREDPGRPLPLSLRQLGMEIGQEKPAPVARWTNLYDKADPVAAQSWNLAAADENAPVEVGAWTGLGAHSGIWTAEETVRRVREAYADLQAPQLLTVEVSQPGYWGTMLKGASVRLEGPVSRQASGDSLLFFEDLPPGRYKLTASAPGCRSRETTVSVTVGRNKVRVDLAAEKTAPKKEVLLIEPQSFTPSRIGAIMTTEKDCTEADLPERSLTDTFKFTAPRKGRLGFRLRLTCVHPDEKPLPAHCAQVRTFPAKFSWSREGASGDAPLVVEGGEASGEGPAVEAGTKLVLRVRRQASLVSCRQRGSSWHVLYEYKSSPESKLEVGYLD
jgi:hypothetical protein